jgi:UDP-N-acetyl-D-mannosaminuronic acid dehydrogenase
MEGGAWAIDVAVMGGCGHVGLPLGLALAGEGLRVALYDTDLGAVDRVCSGKMSHWEPGAQELLDRVLAAGRLSATSEPAVLASAEHVIVVLGTPIDEHLNPDPHAVIDALQRVSEHFRPHQLLVLRSTVFPGVTRMVERLMRRLNKSIDVAFCPERIAEGRAMEELHTLPQIVSGRTNRAFERAEALFRNLTESIVRVTPEEAELAKLFTNSYRYIKFAAANQLYMMANDFGLDYERIRTAIIQDYPRAADLPGAGFAAGPCLLKDTMQLAAFNNNNFHLGHASVQVNEGLPLYLTSKVAARYDLGSMTVGILGMAFKGESDDNRSSLAYKLKRILKVRAARVLTTDPYVSIDSNLSPLDEVLAQADLIIIGAPHRLYADLPISQPVIDIWNVRGNGVFV